MGLDSGRGGRENFAETPHRRAANESDRPRIYTVGMHRSHVTMDGLRDDAPLALRGPLPVEAVLYWCLFANKIYELYGLYGLYTNKPYQSL